MRLKGSNKSKQIKINLTRKNRIKQSNGHPSRVGLWMARGMAPGAVQLVRARLEQRSLD